MSEKTLPERWVVAAFMLAAMAWLAPLTLHPNAIAYWRDAAFTDLLIAHLPNSTFFQRAVQTWAQIPLWNPTILSGVPFAADPLTALWYPANWLTYLSPSAFTFNLLFIAHLAWGGWGMWRWLRAKGMSAPAAALGGLAFSGTPKFIAHIGLGHVNLVYAMSWTPWLLLGLENWRSMLGATPKQWLKRICGAGATLAVITLADPRWALPAGLLGGAYILWQRSGAARATSPDPMRPTWRQVLISGLALTLTAAGAAACSLLPLWELTRLTTRSGLSLVEASTLSLPPEHLLGLLLPFPGQPEWLVYAGVPLLCLAALGMTRPDRRKYFWGALVLLAWIFALGSSTPIYPLLVRLIPGLALLRVPPRWLLLGVVGLCVLAGMGLDLPDPSRSTAKPARRYTVPFAISLSAFLFGLGKTFAFGADPLSTGVVLITFATTCWIVLVSRKALPRRSQHLVWIGLVALDLLWVNTHLLEARIHGDGTPDRTALAQSLADTDGIGRIFSPSYSVPQDLAAAHQLELADGVHPLQLQAYHRYLSAAIGAEPTAYSVTLPPFPLGDPGTPWPVDLDLIALGRLAVGAIVSDFPLPGMATTETASIEGVYRYSNPEARPRVWIEPSVSPGDPWREVESIVWTPNHITVRAAGPGRLVFSEVGYPGWVASIDGGRIPLQTAYQLLRAVELPAGQHTVQLVFRPLSLAAGLLTSLISLSGIAWYWLRR
jgi:hypothetical protein